MLLCKKILAYLPSHLKSFLGTIFWCFYSICIKNLPSENLPTSRGVRLRVFFLKPFLAECGENVNIQPNVTLDGIEKISIGNFSGIGRDSTVSARSPVCIGNDVMIGPELRILTSNHYTARHSIMRMQGGYDAPVTVEDDVWIGGRVTILPGVTIARGCVLAAGAVVTKNTLPYGIYGGVPARRIKDRL